MFILLRKAAKSNVKKSATAGPVKITLTSDDLTKPIHMKTVFISASPVLVNEVSRFYHKLKEALVSHLKRREERQGKDYTMPDTGADVDPVK